jgi:sugar phosphate isomerase/epimerase
VKFAAYVHSMDEMKEVSKLGFEYVALHSMLFPYVEGGMPPNDEQIGEIRRSLKQNGLQPIDLVTFNGWYYAGLSGMMEQLPSGPRDLAYEALRKRGVGQFGKLVEAAQKLGVERIFSLMGGRRVYHHDHEEAWTKSVEDLEPTLERHDIKMCFLPHPGDFIEESDQAVDLIKSTGCKQIKYVYVLPHTFVLAGKMDADPAAMIRHAADAGVLDEVHVADSLKPAQMWVRDHFDTQPYHNHLLPGRGAVDINGALEELVRLRFGGPLLMIPYRYGISDMSFPELAGTARDELERLLAGIAGKETSKRPARSPKAGRR